MAIKYIVYGQLFDVDMSEDAQVEKIAEYDSEIKASEKLARVRQSAEYEYEWIQEVDDGKIA